jgi:hypothetical protein
MDNSIKQSQEIEQEQWDLVITPCKKWYDLQLF